jgi:hypothetical protein
MIQAGRDNFFHKFGVVEGADGRHRCFNVLFNLGCVSDVDAIRQEHAGMSDSEDLGCFMASGGNVDEFDFSVKLFGNFDTFINVVSAFKTHRPDDTDIHRKSAAAFLFDPFKNG